MTKDEFYEELDDHIHDFKTQFLSFYAQGAVDESIEDPLEFAIDMLQEDWEFESGIPEEAVTPWLEDTEALTIAKGRALFERRRMNAIDSFKKKRLAGATFAQASKAAGEKPEYMTQLIKSAPGYEIDEKQFSVLRQARKEEHQHKAYKARQKAYRMISSKVEEAMKTADFTQLPADKLADIILKLAQVTKEDTPPEMTIRVDWGKEV